MLRLIVNNNELEIPQESIKYTMQVNDIGDLSTRQCNYTDGFSVPKSRNNTQFFNQLGLVGDVSQFPYQKVNVDLLDNGIHLIRNGWLDIQETANEYKLNIRDGSIDLFKAIENKTFGDDVDLSEINHDKTLATIVGSFTNENYRYIINDYGGLTHLDNGAKINADYLIPSVRLKYLWDKIFTTFGFEYVGEIFGHIDFHGLWLTYPKGINQEDASNVTEYADYADWNQQLNQYDTRTITTGSGTLTSYTIPVNGSYKIDFSGTEVVTIVDWAGSNAYQGTFDMKLNVNGQEINAIGSISLTLQIGDVITVERPLNYNLPNGDSFASDSTETKAFTVSKYNSEISFSDELKNLKITEFLKEVLIFFGLTIFIDENGKYIFKTFDERLTAGVVDWSNKYKDRTSETYTPKSYAQRNYFRHEYNDKSSGFNNGYFDISNKNINESTLINGSFIYSHEKNQELFRINASEFENVYPTLLWQREANENEGTIDVKYKDLSERFHLIRSQTIDKASIIRSGVLNEEQAVTSFPIARFNMTSYRDFVPKYYNNIRLLLNDFRMHKMRLNLDCVDINQIDFDKLYYFEQEQNYYFLNKLSYQNGKLSNCEFVRVKYSETSVFGFQILITGYDNRELFLSVSSPYTQSQILIENLTLQNVTIANFTNPLSYGGVSGHQIRLRDFTTNAIISNIFIIP
jgi:hypothetical protein